MKNNVKFKIWLDLFILGLIFFVLNIESFYCFSSLNNQGIMSNNAMVVFQFLGLIFNSTVMVYLVTLISSYGEKHN